MYKRILVAVDGSRTSNRALNEAIRLAKNQRAVLRAIHVVDETPTYALAEMPYPVDEYQKAMRAAGQQCLARCSDRAQAARVKVDTKMIVAVTQSIGEVINKEAKRWSADIVVIGTHGRRGLDRMFLGSVAERVIRMATKPILIIHGR